MSFPFSSSCVLYFNSQPHKEADYLVCLHRTNTRNFNSQPHKEADAPTYCTKSAWCISTHSLTRRLTIIDSVFEELTTFQLTASQGG